MTDFTGAPCIGNPELFDASTWQSASVALEACKNCPFRYECLVVVDPAASWYEGVVGGMLWVCGKPMVKEWRRIKPERRPFADIETTTFYMNTRKTDG